MREPKAIYDGPPILSMGFRPFFLAASLFALFRLKMGVPALLAIAAAVGVVLRLAGLG